MHLTTRSPQYGHCSPRAVSSCTAGVCCWASRPLSSPDAWASSSGETDPLLGAGCCRRASSCRASMARRLGLLSAYKQRYSFRQQRPWNACPHGNTKTAAAPEESRSPALSFPPAPKTGTPHLAQGSSSATATRRSARAAMSMRRTLAPCVASSISFFKVSICPLYSSRDWQMASLKSSMNTKSGKKGRTSSILSKPPVSSKKEMALRMPLWEPSLSPIMTCSATSSQSFLRSSSSSAFSAKLLASSTSIFKAARTASSCMPKSPYK
mmetsp:Transcript_27886/g.77977  ORF Transcript_27886/g.77977 Transcript_27886/m.77977 type:complete len:267 (-) Transcript_27886:1441-2241(-)